MRYLLLVLGVVTTVGLLGCDKKTSQPTAASTKSAAAPSKKEPKPAPPKPPDIKLGSITKAIKCPSGDKALCHALNQFEKASRWNFVTIRSNEARYFGHLWVRKNGKTEHQWGMLFIRKVPLNEVEPGDLPVRIAMRQLDSSLGPENKHAPRLMRLLETGHAVNKNRNQTARYVLQYTIGQWYTTGPSKGASVIVDLSNEAYVREGKQRQLFVVQLATSRPGVRADDGTYGVLYPLTW